MKTALLFSGQGAQYPGMMLDVADAFPEARRALDEASEAAGRDLYAQLGGLSREELDRTVNTQPCVLACELAVLRVLRSFGLGAEAAAGFSLGEWAALAAAGVIGEKDAMRLICRRAEAMQRAVPEGLGGMAYILGKEDEDVARLCAELGEVVPANYNIQGNVSVAGTAEGIARFLERGEREGLLVGRIPVSIPSHCWLMQPAAEELAPFIAALDMRPPQMRLFMNATGAEASAPEQIRENLILQLTKPVLFRQTLDALLDGGYDAFVEVGPGSTLGRMVKKAARQRKAAVQVYQAGKLPELERIREALGKAE